MTDYDPSELEKEAENADSKEFYDATITNTRVDVAHNIFGDATQSEPDKEMLVVESEAEVGDEIQTIESVFSLPESKKAWLNPTFKLGRFRAKYGGLPDENIEVQVGYDENGFLEIVIPDRVTPDA